MIFQVFNFDSLWMLDSRRRQLNSLCFLYSSPEGHSEPSQKFKTDILPKMVKSISCKLFLQNLPPSITD